MSRTRMLVGAIGVLIGAYGAWLAVQRPFDDLVNAAEWLVAGVFAHDLLLSPLVVLAGVLLGRLLTWRGAGALVGGLVVLGTVTIMAIPVLGGFGRNPKNPSLLNRDYAEGWFVLLLLVAAVVAVTVLAVRFRHRDRTGIEGE